MSVSRRSQRCDVYTYTAGTTDASGLVLPVYVRFLSDDADGQWWTRRATPSGRQRGPGAQAQNEWDTVFNFAGECAVPENGVLRMGGQVYKMVAILPRDDLRDEWQVQAVRVDDWANQFTLEEPT